MSEYQFPHPFPGGSPRFVLTWGQVVEIYEKVRK
jgi:hypothetical protein